MAEWRVLVVDDDTHMLDLMTRRLGRMGLQADRAQDGRTAIGMVQQTAYDLILTDIYMPGGTGLEILRKAKENDPHVQVIVVTGSATLDNAVEALNMGAFSYLSKPFDHMSVFDNSVSRALEFRRLIRDNQRMAEIQRRRGDMLEAEVTDRIRQMRRKQQDMVDLLARLPEGVLVVDGEGRVLVSNATAEEWLAREARLEVQPLRRYLSTLTPPRRPTKSETEIDGVYLRLRAQALPPEEGKPRILVTIGEAGEEGVDIRRQLSGSVARLKPGLDWLARQALDEKETDVVRLLLTQVAAIETMLGPEAGESRARRVAEVDWEGLALEEEPEPEAAEVEAEAGQEPPPGAAKRGKASSKASPVTPWPPPRAGQEKPRQAAERKKPAPSPPPMQTEEARRFATVLLSEEGLEIGQDRPPAGPAPPISPAAPSGQPTTPAEDLDAGLERLLQHLAETPAPQEPEPLALEAEIQAEVEEPLEEPPVPTEPEPVEPTPVPKKSQGLLGKMRREGKAKAAPEPPTSASEKISEPELQVPPAPLQAAPASAHRPPEPGRLQRGLASPPSAPDIKPRTADSGSFRREAAPEPETPAAEATEHPSGLLGKVRRSLKQAGTSEETPGKAAKAPPTAAPAVDRHDRTPIPERLVPPDKELSELLDAVREAAGVTDGGSPREPSASEGPGDRGRRPPADKRAPVWPPPPPSEEDEE